MTAIFADGIYLEFMPQMLANIQKYQNILLYSFVLENTLLVIPSSLWNEGALVCVINSCRFESAY